jgi:hypothetical protein
MPEALLVGLGVAFALLLAGLAMLTYEVIVHPHRPGPVRIDALTVARLANGDADLQREIEDAIYRHGYRFVIALDAWCKMADEEPNP